jgi:hypothetical protein
MTNWTEVADITTNYTEVADSSERYIPEGVGLKVASEDFTWMLTEDKLTRLIHNKTDFTEVGDTTTSYTEVGDVTTVYTKVEDA